MLVDIENLDPPEEWGVRVDPDTIEAVAGSLASHHFAPPSFDYPGVPALDGEAWARFVLLGVAVVWRLWPPDDQQMWAAELNGEWLEDAAGIWSCFAREPRSTDLVWYATGGPDQRFFAGRGHLQDIPRRLDLLSSVAETLLSRWRGHALQIVEASGARAGPLTELLVETIPGFWDRPHTDRGDLPFDKLAHLAVAMLSARIPITGVEEFPVYPDYMLPRHLRHLGILVYEPGLAAAVDERRLIPRESEWELAIRWGTVRAAALLRRSLSAVGNVVTTPQLDYWLWSEAVLGPDATAMGEHHRTLTEAY
jgi:hypothetical protein